MDQNHSLDVTAFSWCKLVLCGVRYKHTLQALNSYCWMKVNRLPRNYHHTTVTNVAVLCYAINPGQNSGKYGWNNPKWKSNKRRDWSVNKHSWENGLQTKYRNHQYSGLAWEKWSTHHYKGRTMVDGSSVSCDPSWSAKNLLQALCH